MTDRITGTDQIQGEGSGTGAGGRDIPSTQRCPLCGETPGFLYDIPRFTPSLRILRCPGCGLQMQERPPGDIASLYGEGYYAGTADYSYRDERSTAKYDRYVWNARLHRIARIIPPPADFLDIGCSFGGFLEAAKERGYRVHGTDISPFAGRIASEKGLKIKTGGFRAGLYPSASMDVVTMIEVLEHMPDPAGLFSTLREIVRPGGLLVIQTANFEGLQAKRAGADYHYYLPGHLFYYSTKNLRMALRSHGFDRIRFYRGVDFGLLPKLLKSRGGFRRLSDYRRWISIAFYHWKSRLAFGDFALTSSMVVYARRAR